MIINDFKEKVYIIILNWNGWNDTYQCLMSLQKITYQNYQILFVDNGSTDGSIQNVKKYFPEIEVIENGSNLGFAEGNNRGILNALGKNSDYIMLLNNDTVVAPNFIEPLIAAFNHNPKVGYASSKIYYFSSPNNVWFFGGEVDWKSGWAYHKNPNQFDDGMIYNGNLVTEIVTGCCLLAKKEVFEQVGLLDSRFFLIYEDVDWCIRASDKGYQGLVVSESIIWHKVSASFKRDIPAQGAFYFTRNGLLFITKHSKKPILTSLNFIWHWVVLISLREARNKQHFWFRNFLIRMFGILAWIFHWYYAAPKYLSHLAR